MDICHSHNLVRPPTAERRYGIRMRLPPGDTFSRILGEDWEGYRWYGTAEERDRAFDDIASRHLYSRSGDYPTLVMERIDRQAEDPDAP